VVNETEISQTVTVRVSHKSAKEVLLEKTRVVPTGEKVSARSISFHDPINSGGVRQIQVTVEGGPSGTYDWEVWGDDGQQDESHSLAIYLHPTEIEFAEGAA